MYKYGAIFVENEYHYYYHVFPSIPYGGSFPIWKGRLQHLYDVVGNTLERLILEKGLEFVSIEVTREDKHRRDEVLYKCCIMMKEPSEVIPKNKKLVHA